MLNSKERAKLRGIASTEKAVFQLGKEDISDGMTEGLKSALEARELIKVSVLKNCNYLPEDLSKLLELKLGAETVSIIGNKIILYKKSSRKDFKHLL